MNDVPVLAAVRRYLTEAVSGRNPAMLAEILVPDYRFDGGGTPVIGRDDTYIPMVSTYLAGEPTIDTAAHEIVTDGRHAAVWLTKHTDSPRAAWEAVLIYRARGTLLERCWSEQDWATRRRQLKGQQPPGVTPTPAPGVWETPPDTPDAGTEKAATAWLTGLPDLAAAFPDHTPRPVLDVTEVEIGCLFTAGARFAFHVTHRGAYLDGLAGCGEHRGHPAELNLAGLGTLTEAGVSCTRAIADATELRRRLTAPAAAASRA